MGASSPMQTTNSLIAALDSSKSNIYITTLMSIGINVSQLH